MTSLRTRSVGVSLVVALSSAGLSGCLAAPVPVEEETRPPAVIEVAPAASSSDDAVNRVLAISIDGLNPRAIRKLGRAGAPSFHRMMREGDYTLNARTEYEMTKTLPSHTGMLTGRRVVATKHGHGIDFNTDSGTTVHKQAGHYVASVFDVVHDRGGRTALFSAKKKFKLYQRTWNTHGRSDKVGKNHGKSKIDRVTLDTDNARLVRALNADLRRSPRTFTFLHISLPDVAGHKYGFMSKKYLSAVKESDRLLGTVLNTVGAKSSLKAHTLVVLTADHGGDGSRHGKPGKLQNYRVPFMAWGPGVAKGRNLYAINSSFKAPKTSRPSYAGKQPIRNGDVANLATDALDLPAVPGSELDRPRSLDVFGR